MLDTAQTVLLLVVVVLTALLVVLGIQVYFILRELRQTVTKANKVLDDTGQITESVSGPLSTLSSLAAGLKTGATFMKLLTGRSSKKQKRTTSNE